MAVARGGPTASAVLERVSASTLQAALDPLVARDAVLVADGGRAYPGCARALGVPHEAVNLSAGERVRGSCHIQTANSRHSQFKSFLRPFRGVASKYLDSLSALVPASRTLRPALPTGLLGCRPGYSVQTFRQLSLEN